MDNVRIIEMERIRAQIHQTDRKSRAKTTIDICRKGSIVKEKCRQLTGIASRLFPDGLVRNADLEAMVEDYCGANKETVRAYLGYAGRVRRSRKTGEGYVIGEKRRGYIESFGFMHRLNRETWRINQQLLPSGSSCQVNEGLTKDTMKKSLSHDQLRSNERKEILIATCDADIETTERITNKQNTEKERNFQQAPAQAENTTAMLCGKIKKQQD
jgi:hypothetical protein